jgi:sugar phosphate permease
VRYPWTSPPVLSLFAISLVVGAGFVWRLATAPEPLIPISILADPIARYIIAANAFGWASIVGLNIFLPMYLQSVMGLSATTAGLSLMVIMATVNTSAGINGQIMVRVQHYKMLPMLGLALSIASVLALAWQAENLNLWWFEVLLALIGLGFGGIPPLAATVLQNTVAIQNFGTAIGTMQFSRGLFGTILVALFGALVLIGTTALGPDTPGNISTNNIYNAEGFARVFFMAAASLAAALICLALLEEKPLQTSRG